RKMFTEFALLTRALGNAIKSIVSIRKAIESTKNLFDDAEIDEIKWDLRTIFFYPDGFLSDIDAILSSKNPNQLDHALMTMSERLISSSYRVDDAIDRFKECFHRRIGQLRRAGYHALAWQGDGRADPGRADQEVVLAHVAGGQQTDDVLVERNDIRVVGGEIGIVRCGSQGLTRTTSLGPIVWPEIALSVVPFSVIRRLLGLAGAAPVDENNQPAGPSAGCVPTSFDVVMKVYCEFKSLQFNFKR